MKIYIAEDESLAAAKLKLFLEKLGEGGDISLFDNGVSALAAIQKEQPDLLFLDIQMPGLTGLQVMNQVQGLPIIVTSAYDQYAIDSFNFNVTDYLLKPYTMERLKSALDKAKKRIKMLQWEKENQSAQFSIRTEGRNEVIDANDILYVESIKDYVRIVTLDGQQRLTLASLSSFEEKLDSQKFLRVHRSFIINRTKITNSTAQSVTMTNGQEIPIGRKYKANTK